MADSNETKNNHRKRLALVIVLAVVGILMIGLMVILNTQLIKNKHQAESSIASPEIQAEMPQTTTPDVISTYLPNLYRANENSNKESTATALRDPFTRGLTLKGLLTGGSGNNLAIIEFAGNVHIVSPGDLLEEGWTVLEINKDRVILSDGEKSLTLNF